ncbi:transmembrane protein 163 [Caerostris extrusa]|uniref:Transmembrane protein 163 n=1 Tax=Caerostris extrusa TaxID=172846 RepID=A0AAV4XHT6_CAEEX|nr:transmembrane protein 163 [Caerostris extrusa]
MATEGRGKRQSVCYKYNVAQSTLSEGVSVTLKEMSMQMADDAERLRMYALLTCIITQWCSTSSLALLLLCAAATDSSAGYAFALDCLLDVIAATLVIWRFYGSASTYSDFKENVACICLGILFCLSSIAIVSKSAHDLVSHHVPQQLVYVFILAAVGGS